MAASADTTAIEITVSNGGVLASLHGRIDIDSSPAVRDRLLTLLNAPHPDTVAIDFSALTHIDSSGVATLIEVLKIARRYKTAVTLQGLQGPLLRLFEITGILSLFNGSSRT